MPVSRRTTEGLGAEVAAVYAGAEVRLLSLMARYLSAGVDAPGWATAKLAELQTFRRRADAIMSDAVDRAAGMVSDATRDAYTYGQAAAQGELDQLGRPSRDIPPRQAEYATEALTRAQAGRLDDLGPQVLRQTEDAYRDAVARASAGTLTGSATRRQDAAEALDDLARRGISGFTDAAGRRWGLEAYVDMATRTTTAQASIQGHMDRLEDAGINLFLVSTSSRECERCRPWEGMVLSRGPVDAVQVNVLTGAVERVDVDGTVQDATRAGLFHPNCTHNLSGYVHGATKRGEATGNAEGYAEKQELRRLERGAAEWNRRAAAAMSPEQRRRAEAKRDGWRRRAADHANRTGVARKPYRETWDDGRTRTPRGRPDVPVSQLPDDLLDRASDDALEAELARLMDANAWGARLDRVGAELDNRDRARGSGPFAHELPDEADTLAEQAAVRAATGGPSIPGGGRFGKRKTKADLERDLRDEHDTWVHHQWLRAEAECKVLLTRRAAFDGVDPSDLIRGKKRDQRRYASPEFQEWLARPGNEPLSFPEFRAGIMDDRDARDARTRLSNRGWSSEYG